MFASSQGWKRVLRITLYIKILIILGLWTEWITETAVRRNAPSPILVRRVVGTALEQEVDSDIVRRLFPDAPRLSPRYPHLLSPPRSLYSGFAIPTLSPLHSSASLSLCGRPPAE
jgi:hypothetical protein